MTQSVQFTAHSGVSAILEKIDRTWLSSKFIKIFAVFSGNVCTSLQITFLTNLTGIIS